MSKNSEDLVEAITDTPGGIEWLSEVLASRISDNIFKVSDDIEIVSSKTCEFGEELTAVLKLGERFFKFAYYNSSFGSDWVFDEVLEVFPKKVVTYEFD